MNHVGRQGARDIQRHLRRIQIHQGQVLPQTQCYVQRSLGDEPEIDEMRAQLASLRL